MFQTMQQNETRGTHGDKAFRRAITMNGPGASPRKSSLGEASDKDIGEK